MPEKILITSALPYANGPLHFGHIAGAYLPGDCYARFQRLVGNDVLYICGSDEHGVAITLSAEVAHRTPKEQVDFFHEINLSFFKKLHFSFDHFSRTTCPGHVTTTQDFYEALNKKGLIEEREELHLYSESENRFLADRYVLGTCPKCGYGEARGDECQKCASYYDATDLKNPRSKLTGSPLVLKPSSHLYLHFEKFKERLLEWIKDKKWKDNVLHFAMGYIDELKSRAITRDSSWGVPVPGHPGKVFYVWFDAPIGYISATKEWAEKQGKPSLWEDYWFDSKTKFVQFIGKDNIPFHAVFFPAMLMGQDLSYKLPDEIPANEFFLLEGKQFSKSDGWYIDLEDFFKKYSSDQIRYAIAANAPETSDAEFSWKDFQMRCNTELVGKFGNFINRVLTFAKMHCNSSVPARGDLNHLDLEFLQNIKTLMEMGLESYQNFHLRKATQIFMDLCQLGNVYFNVKKPWMVLKNPDEKKSLETTISLCLECIVRLALISCPIIPESSQKIWEMIGFKTELCKENWAEIDAMILQSGQKIGEPELLFRKIEDSEIEDQVIKLGKINRSNLMDDALRNSSKLVYEPLKPSVDFTQFEKLDLRVAQIISATKVVKSKKLLKIVVDLGFEKRTVVSGIALSYEPEILIGRKVVVVANLSPATIMGIESQGMILAGSLNGDLELSFIQTLLPGSVIS